MQEQNLSNFHNEIRVTVSSSGVSISEFSTKSGMLPKPIESSKLGSPVSLLFKATVTALGLTLASVLTQYNTSFLSLKF